MRKSWSVLYLSAFVLCISSSRLQAQTDAAASVYGAFNSSTSGNSTMQSPSNTAGALLELRHIWNSLAGVEATYSYNRANQTYSTVEYPPCPVGVLPCGPYTITSSIPNNAHEITGDWVVSMKFANVRPFVLAGGGVLLNLPATGTATEYVTNCSSGLPLPPCSVSNGSISTSTQTKAVYVYGAGLDWTVLLHLGLRFQYRGNLYKAPDLTDVFSSTNSFTHNSEPMIGAFFRF
jgi:opacity protein-like surface antigen